MDTMDILDMGDYMEVVMTYKCRFCTYFCTSVQEMGTHVKDVHLKNQENTDTEHMDPNANQGKESAGVGKVVLDESDHVMKIDQSNAEGKIETTGSQACEAGDQEQNSVNENVNQDSGQLFQTVSVQQNPTHITVSPLIDSLVNMGTGAHGSVQNLGKNTLEKISAMNLGEVLNIPSGSNVAVPTINENGNMTFTIDGKTVELTVGEEEQAGVEEKDGKPEKIEGLSEQLTIVDESNCLGGENSETITKEVFLCGQCNVGFDSMDECKSHMFKEHEVNPDSNIEYEAEGKVSIGTQVEGQKKRGRKRKGEVKEDDDKDYRPKLDELEDSDVEWTIESEQSTRGSRTRRKIRPPKALESDYYIGKTKSKRKDHHHSSTVSKKEYNLRCNFEGFNCYAKFITQEALNQHLKCHVQGDNLFKCSECSSVFLQWSKLRIHLWTKHVIDTDLITCDVCGIYKTDAPSKLLIHKEVHGEDRPYTCDTCGKCFKQFCQMKNHQITHEEVRMAASEEKWYHEKQCKICKRIFANKKCLDKHMQGVHGGEKPFTCNFCSYASSRKHMLQLHLRTHTHEKPFKCEICNYATGDHNSMRRHKMRHSGQRPYKCKMCPYSCIQAIALKMHVRNKHRGMVEEGVFSCDKCSYRTINERMYKYHLEDHKNGLVPEGQPATLKSRSDQKVIVATTNGNIIQTEGDLVENAFIEIQTDRSQEGLASNQLEMQVQTLKTGETTISVDDLAKLTNHGGLVPPEISATQLIQFALNAIAQNSNETVIEGENELNGVQTSIDSSSNQDGVTMHTIRFHLPTANETNVAENQINISSETFKEGEVYQIMEGNIEVGRSAEQNQELENAAAEVQVTQAGAVGNNETIYLNIQGQNLPVNVISLDQAQCLMNQSATIQDLAQVSCLVKESQISGNNPVELLSNQGNMSEGVQSDLQE